MGWVFDHKPKGESMLEFFRREFDTKSPSPGDPVGRVLDCAATLHEAYIAYERVWPEGRREVNAIVCELMYRPNDFYNFGYKDVDEEMGPIHANCPERILRLLTPTDNETARRWREECWENLRARRGRPRLRKGVVIRFSEPVRFTSGSRLSEFRVEDPRRLVFSDPRYPWNRYKLSRRTLRNRSWEIVEQQSVGLSGTT
ncbi:MAG: hypothetical protein AB1609_12030 [Bacillota bacterium]